MKIRVVVIILTCILSGSCFCQEGSSKKVKQSLKIDKVNSKTLKENSTPEGKKIIISDTLIDNNDLLNISFKGYEKEIQSNQESFIIVNPTEKEIIGFEIKIDYLDMNGRMLHSRIVNESCEVPARESRKINIRSWDTQHTYYYYLGNEPRKVATPYKVKFTPVSYMID